MAANPTLHPSVLRKLCSPRVAARPAGPAKRRGFAAMNTPEATAGWVVDVVDILAPGGICRLFPCPVEHVSPFGIGSTQLGFVHQQAIHIPLANGFQWPRGVNHQPDDHVQAGFVDLIGPLRHGWHLARLYSMCLPGCNHRRVMRKGGNQCSPLGSTHKGYFYRFLGRVSPYVALSIGVF